MAEESQIAQIATGRFKPLVSLIRHKWIALLLFLITMSFAAYTVLQKTDPQYIARAELLVSPTFINNVFSDRNLTLRGKEYLFYIEQQERILIRKDVLQAALADSEIKELWMQPGETERQAIRRLQSSINTRSNGHKSPFIKVSLKSGDKEGLAETLNAVIDSFLQASQAENFYDSSGQIKRLQAYQAELTNIVARKDAQRLEIAKQLGVTTFQSSGLNPYDHILINSTQEYTKARRQRVEEQAKLDAINADKGYKSQLALESLAEEKAMSQPGFSQFKSTLMRERAERLGQTLGIKPQHPTYKRAQQEIEKIDRYIAEVENEAIEEVSQQIINQHQSSIYQARQIENALAEEVEEQSKHAANYSVLYNQAINLTNEIERAKQELQTIGERINFLTLESDAPGFVRLHTAAVPPRFPITQSSKKMAILLAMISLALTIGVPIALDFLDNRVQTPGEVHKILGFPPLVWLLKQKNAASQQLALDYLRRLALILARDTRVYQTRCFALTSVKAGGGTSTLTLELAQTLTRLGYRSIAVELNAYRPDRRYQGVDPSKGLQTLLKAKTPLPIYNYIVPAEATLPERLPVGETEGRQLIPYGKLNSVIEELQQQYDVVLIDAPPILLSADAELISEINAGVLLVIEAKHIIPGELKRAAHLLERLEPPVVAAVLNHVEVFQGGGYFSQLLREHVQGKRPPTPWFKRWLWG